MGRIRTVKPELFMDEELGVLSGDHTVLFTGLLTLADKRGILEDRPTRIKAALFPYRPVETEGLLQDLEDARKIARYSDASGRRCIFILKFAKHQRPHPKEPESDLGAPSLEDLPGKNTASREKTRPAIHESDSSPSRPVGREGKGREGDLGREGVSASADPLPLPKIPEGQNRYSSGDAFFAWVQGERVEAKLAVEKFPREVNRWFSEVMLEVNGDGSRLEATFRGFLRDPYWRERNWPFLAFMKQWRGFVPRGVAA